jgi:hypothetical protein
LIFPVGCGILWLLANYESEKTMLNNLLFKFYVIQDTLFPILEETLDMSQKHQELVKVIELMRTDGMFARYGWVGNGRIPAERELLFRAFVAKSVFNITTNTDLILRLRVDRTLRALCGYDGIGDIPSESTFSRAFADFARDELPQRIHAAMIEDTVEEKLFAHNSIDATAVEGREKPAKKEKEDTPKPKKKRGRPKKGEEAPPPEPKRIEVQPNRSLEENIKDLPAQCDVGTKRNSKGHTTHWIGYKLHLGVVDGDIPVAAILTSASTHDSQVAIPLMQMTNERLDTMYDLMDAAYDAQGIHDFSRSLGHVPIIDPNKRAGEVIPMDPAKKQRYKQRSSAERANSALKDNYGGRFVRVRGAAKVMAHLMFGVIALTAAQLCRLIG